MHLRYITEYTGWIYGTGVRMVGGDFRVVLYGLAGGCLG